jgi:ribosome-binding protein aMBF1 (putative translation factor)
MGKYAAINGHVDALHESIEGYDKPSPETLSAIEGHIALIVRTRRRELGLTELQLGMCIGLTYLQIQGLETGEIIPTSAQIWHLSKALMVPIDDFFDLDKAILI